MAKCVEGKVIVVTGAGRGIGREISMLAAAEGAKVVVNDLGGSAEGEGADVKVADQVVAEIKKAGGIAVANGDSVADPQGAERIIKTAIDNFGRIDCVVNNAGILRDRIFHRMSAVDWDAVIKVHLYGAFYMSKAAAPYFKDQESGSFVHFTSTSGPRRQLRPGQLCRGQARHRRAVQVDCARHVPLPRALQLRISVRLVAPDRHHSHHDAGGERTRRSHPEHHDGLQDRADLRVPRERPVERRDRSDFRRPQGRDLPDEPIAPDPRCAQGRGLDPAGHRRNHAASIQKRPLPAGPLGGRVQLGAALRRLRCKQENCSNVYAWP